MNLRQINKKFYFFLFILSISSNFSGFAQTLSIIENPDGGNFRGSQLVYKDLLFYRYQGEDHLFHLTQFDGGGSKMFSPLRAGDTGFEANSPNDIFVFKDVLYHTYVRDGKGFVAFYNGSDYRLITNPDTGLGNQGCFVEYRDALHFVYVDERKYGTTHL